MESEKEQEDTYEKYLEEINNVSDLPHAIHVSEECGIQPGISKSSIPNTVGVYTVQGLIFSIMIIQNELCKYSRLDQI